MRWFETRSLVAALGLLSCQRGDDPNPSLPAPELTPGASARPEHASTPGRVTLRRLNRAEYDLTVQHLLQVDLSPARAFPPDDYGYGFDNIAEVLSLSPLHVELYEAAADELMTHVLGTGRSLSTSTRYEAEEAPVVTTVGGGGWDAYWYLWSNGDAYVDQSLDAGGRWAFRVRAAAQQAGPDPARMALSVDGTLVETFDVPQTIDAPALFEAVLDLAPGIHRFTVSFLNDFYDPDAGLDRNLAVDWLEVEGPLDATEAPTGDPGVVLTCLPAADDPSACTKQIARDFGGRAWRRPLTEAEVDALAVLVDEVQAAGGSWEEGVRWMGKAILLSPHFLFRVEADPPAGTAVRDLDGWELASRLSYFLWSSMPDEELFALAASGELTQPEVLEAQVRRLLADPKAWALVDNLAGPWLYVRAIDDATPSIDTFPDWDEELRASMKEEMRQFAASVLLHDRPMTDLMTAQETWVDDRLAAHYGLPAPSEPWGLVSTPERPGLLGRAGLLTALSYPTRTSPVKRGKWVLGNLLCEEPAPPPPGVEALPEESEGGAESLREQMERHRADPVCASCHQAMDPIGFGLEGFDAIGRARTTDASGASLDTQGVLPDGRQFSGPTELAAVLAADPKLTRCMVQKTFTYALGRPPGVEDLVHLDSIQGEFEDAGGRFADLAVALVLSPPFRQRAAPEDE